MPAPPLLSSRFGLRLSYLSPLPTPLSPLPSPHSRLPSRSLSILFGLLSCCLIVPASRHVVLHRRVSSRRIVVYVSSCIVSSLHCIFASRCAHSVRLVVVFAFPAASPRASSCPRFGSSLLPSRRRASHRRNASRLAATSYCITLSSLAS